MALKILEWVIWKDMVKADSRSLDNEISAVVHFLMTTHNVDLGVGD